MSAQWTEAQAIYVAVSCRFDVGSYHHRRWKLWKVGGADSQFSKTTSRANRNFQGEIRKKFANAASEKFVCTPLLTGREYAILYAGGSYDVVMVMKNCTNAMFKMGLRSGRVRDSRWPRHARRLWQQRRALSLWTKSTVWWHVANEATFRTKVMLLSPIFYVMPAADKKQSIAIDLHVL